MSRMIVPGFLAAFAAAAMLSPVTATAAPMGLTSPEANSGLVQEAGWLKRRRTTVVDAPTTSVRTNDAYTDVDAPLTSVRKGPRGTHIRAPFVNLWVPRN